MNRPPANSQKRGTGGFTAVSKGGIGDGDPSSFSEWVQIEPGILDVRPMFRGWDRAFKDLARRLRRVLDDPHLARMLDFVWRKLSDGVLVFTTTQLRKYLEQVEKGLGNPVSNAPDDKELDLRLDFLVELGLITPKVDLDAEGTFNWGLDNIKIGGRRRRNKWKIQAPISQHRLGFEVGGFHISVVLKVEMDPSRRSRMD